MDLLNPVLEEMVAECIHKMPKDLDLGLSQNEEFPFRGLDYIVCLLRIRSVAKRMTRAPPSARG